jgi:hypothetical protein
VVVVVSPLCAAAFAALLGVCRLSKASCACFSSRCRTVLARAPPLPSGQAGSWLQERLRERSPRSELPSHGFTALRAQHALPPARTVVMYRARQGENVGLELVKAQSKGRGAHPCGARACAETRGPLAAGAGLHSRDLRPRESGQATKRGGHATNSEAARCAAPLLQRLPAPITLVFLTSSVQYESFRRTPPDRATRPSKVAIASVQRTRRIESAAG